MRYWLVILFILITPTLSLAQTQVGTCDQFHPGTGGQFCNNNGSASQWVNFSGDINNEHGTPQCSPTNNKNCGKITVTGVNGIPFNGTLTPSFPTWCLNANGNQMIPCAGGGTGAGNDCNGPVTCVNGVGLFAAACVGANVPCTAVDTIPTHYAFPVTFPQPSVQGSVTIVCNGNDTLQVTCGSLVK